MYVFLIQFPRRYIGAAEQFCSHCPWSAFWTLRGSSGGPSSLIFEGPASRVLSISDKIFVTFKLEWRPSDQEVEVCWEEGVHLTGCNWGFPKLGVPFLGSLFKDYGILGSILGIPLFRETTYSFFGRHVCASSFCSSVIIAILPPTPEAQPLSPKP